MKPEHLKEATKLASDHKVLKEQLDALHQAEDLKVNFFNRMVTITKDDARFERIRNAMVEFLNHQIAALYRRANQIGLHIQPVVLAEPVKISPKAVSAPNLIHSLDDGPTIADQAEALFGKPVLR